MLHNFILPPHSNARSNVLVSAEAKAASMDSSKDGMKLLSPVFALAQSRRRSH